MAQSDQRQTNPQGCCAMEAQLFTAACSVVQGVRPAALIVLKNDCLPQWQTHQRRICTVLGLNAQTTMVRLGQSMLIVGVLLMLFCGLSVAFLWLTAQLAGGLFVIALILVGAGASVSKKYRPSR